MNKEKEERLKDMWNTIKHTNKNIMGVLKWEEGRRGRKNIWILWFNNFPNLMKKINLHMQEALWTPVE